jgi:hypothetical protein
MPGDGIEPSTRGFSRTAAESTFRRKYRRLGPFENAGAAHLPQQLIPIVRPRTAALIAKRGRLPREPRA